MKTRIGFVSNSSSCSFVCDVTGRTESGWDACPSDFSMFVCEKGHTISSGYLIDADLDDAEADMEECNENGNYDLPSKYCPICQFKNIAHDMRIMYLYRKYGLTNEKIDAEIKERFNNYNEFNKFLYPPEQNQPTQ